jgi:hypothetical protein
VVALKEESVPPESANFEPQRDRWDLPMPGYQRYGPGSDSPYAPGPWNDPFHRSRLKADKPVFAKTLFSFIGDSITAFDARRLPTPAGHSTARPDEPDFFGRGGQIFFAQTFRMTFDLFHGDTAAFKPVDWRIRVTPTANINFLAARENQVVSPNDGNGTTRLDGHVGL